MTTSAGPSDETTRVAGTTRRGRSGWFFVGLGSALFAAVLAGFAPSFYLRPFFVSRPLPPYVIVHGVVLTAWFALAVAQAWLVAARRVDLHRRLGVAGVVTAALVVPVSLLVTVRDVPRGLAAGIHPDELAFIVIGNFLSLGVFSSLVSTAVIRRHRPDWHKRLMAIASIMIIGPAVARFERLGLPAPVLPAFFVLLGALWVHDYRTLGHVHRATVVGSSLVIAALVTLLLVLATPVAPAIIDALR